MLLPPHKHGRSFHILQLYRQQFHSQISGPLGQIMKRSLYRAPHAPDHVQGFILKIVHPAVERRTVVGKARPSLLQVHHPIMVVHQRPPVIVPGNGDHKHLPPQIKLRIPVAVRGTDPFPWLVPLIIIDFLLIGPDPQQEHIPLPLLRLNQIPMSCHRNPQVIDQAQAPVGYNGISGTRLIGSEQTLTTADIYAVVCLRASAGCHQIVHALDMINVGSFHEQAVIHISIIYDMASANELKGIPVQLAQIDHLVGGVF